MTDKEQIEYYENYVLRSQEERNNFYNFIKGVRFIYENADCDSQKILKIGLEIDHLKERNQEFGLKYLI